MFGCDFLLLYLFASALLDMTLLRLENRWILFGFASALMLRAGYGGFGDMAKGFLAACPLILLYALRVMGAGDVKLLMVTGCFLGGEGLYRCLLPALLCSLPLAVFLIVFGGAGTTLAGQNVKQRPGSRSYPLPGKWGGWHVIPLAPAIFLGVMYLRLKAFCCM